MNQLNNNSFRESCYIGAANLLPSMRDLGLSAFDYSTTLLTGGGSALAEFTQYGVLKAHDLMKSLLKSEGPLCTQKPECLPTFKNGIKEISQFLNVMQVRAKAFHNQFSQSSVKDESVIPSTSEILSVGIVVVSLSYTSYRTACNAIENFGMFIRGSKNIKDSFTDPDHHVNIHYYETKTVARAPAFCRALIYTCISAASFLVAASACNELARRVDPSYFA